MPIRRLVARRERFREGSLRRSCSRAIEFGILVKYSRYQPSSERRVLVQFDKEASQACDIASQRTRRFARLAQILRGAKSACSRMTNQTAPLPSIVAACAAEGFCVYIESVPAESQFRRSNLNPPEGKRLHGVVFFVLCYFRILQHPLRNRLAAVIHGSVRSNQRNGFHCAFHVHGRSGTGVVAQRTFDSEGQQQNHISRVASLCACRTSDRCVSASSAASIAGGTKSAAARGRLFFWGLLHRLWNLDRADSDSVVRLHGSNDSRGHARHTRNFPEGSAEIVQLSLPGQRVGRDGRRDIA